MKKLAWLALGSTLISGSALANTITSEMGLDVLVINGKEVRRGDQVAPNAFDISKGENQIVVRFDKLVKKGGGSKTESFSSAPYIVTFSSDNDVQIKQPDEVKNKRSAELEFNKKSPNWRLNSGDKAISYSTEVLPGSGGFMPYSDMAALVVAYNQTNGISLANNTVTDYQKAVVEVKESGEVKVSGDTGQQLQYWYTKATKQERKAFRLWVIEQDFQ